MIRLRGGLYTWMATICSNLALDTMRSKHFRKDVVTDQLESKISQINKVNQVFMNIDRLDVRAHVKKLRSLYHEPLLLYSLGYTNSEIGQRLKIPLGTVKSRIRLGLILLRKVWAV
jgi:RNA polymerase sigma-70 factor (ECF subfamily)